MAPIQGSLHLASCIDVMSLAQYTKSHVSFIMPTGRDGRVLLWVILRRFQYRDYIASDG
jgi:hypothetical protein